MQNDTGLPLKALQVDGGACRNDYLMQFQADLLQSEIVRPVNFETTALGAAMLAALAVGIFKDKNQLRDKHSVERVFKPQQSKQDVATLVEGWKKAIESTIMFK